MVGPWPQPEVSPPFEGPPGAIDAVVPPGPGAKSWLSTLAWWTAGLAAIVAGVLGALGLWSVTGPEQSRPGPPPSAEQPGSSLYFQPEAGDCVRSIGPAHARQAVAVSCADPHLFEVAGLIDVSATMATAPTGVEWRALLASRCPDLLRAYVGPSYDPFGPLRLRFAAPTAQEWADGDRFGECLIHTGTDAEGSVVAFVGTAAEVNQTPPLPPGQCLAGPATMDAPATPVACTEPHQLEVLGALPLGERFEHYPSDEQWAALDQDCVEALQARLGPSPTTESGAALEGAALRIPVLSWLAGRRLAACVFAEQDAWQRSDRPAGTT